MLSWRDIVRNYRALIGFAGLAILLIPLLPIQLEHPYMYIRLDYILTASLVLATVAAVADLRAYSRASLASTLLLELVGLSLVWLVRAYLIIYTFIYNSHRFYIGGFTWGPDLAQVGYVMTFLGSSAIALSVSLHAVVGGPIVLARTLTFEELLTELTTLLNNLGKRPALLSFVIGLLVRLLPEVIWGPRLIGYDTVSYVAHLRDFTSSPSLFGSYYWMGSIRNVPPLLDWILYPAALVADPAVVFKVYPPVAYGLLVAVTCVFSMRVLGLSDRTSTVAAIAVALSLISLRLSWDLQKQVLAQILILASLTLVDSSSGELRKLLTATPLLVLAGLASEFGAAVAIIVSFYVLVLHVAKMRGWGRTLAGAAYLVVVIASYILISWYMRAPVVESPIVGYAPPTLTSSVGERELVIPYILICLGPVLPLYFAGVERLGNRARVSTATTTTLLALSVIPLIAPWTDVTGSEWDRVLMSASQVVISVAISQLGLLKGRVARAALLALIITPGALAVGTEGLNSLNSALTSSLKRMPPGMVPAAPTPEVYDAALKVAEEVSKVGRPIVVSYWFDRFVHLYVRNPKLGDIVVVADVSPQQVACVMVYGNLSKAYVVAYSKWGEVVEVDISREFCGNGFLVVGNKLHVELVVEEKLVESLFRVLEVHLYDVKTT